MPCSCEMYSGEGYAIERDECKKRADAATRAACDLRTILRRGGTEADLTEETRKWVARHDKADARRVREERAKGEREGKRRRAKRKYDRLMRSMTLEERRVLGL